MIKTKCFVSVFLLLIFNLVCNLPTTMAEETLAEISLPPSEKPQLNIGDTSRVYLPSRLVIGQDNIFIIKGKPGKKVSLAISSSNRGANPLFGKKLRLGETEQTLEANIPATGILELVYKLPNDTSLVNRTKYFEVALWSKDDFSDLEIAKTISPAAKETLNNGLVISLPPSSGKAPSFAPVIPGMGQDLIRSIEHIKDVQEGKVNSELMDDGKVPAYLDSPEKRDIMLQNINNK